MLTILTVDGRSFACRLTLEKLLAGEGEKKDV